MRQTYIHISFTGLAVPKKGNERHDQGKVSSFYDM